MEGRSPALLILTLDHQEAPAQRDASRCLHQGPEASRGKTTKRSNPKAATSRLQQRGPLASSTEFVRGLSSDQAPCPHISVLGPRVGGEVKCMRKARLWETQGQDCCSVLSSVSSGKWRPRQVRRVRPQLLGLDTI